jgi:hypothetical protein
MNPMANMHHILCKSWKRCNGDPGNDYTSLQGRRHEPYMGVRMACLVWGRLGKKRARQVNSKVRRMLVIFFGIKGIVHKEFILAGQTVNSACYCDILWQLHENV